jgi:phage terminase small subunit
MNRKPALNAQEKTFAQQFLTNLALQKPRGRAASEAAKAAGYRGSSIASNARRLAQDKRVKGYMAELASPPKPPEVEAAEAQVTATVDDARERLSAVVLAEIDLTAIKPTDKIAAVRELSLINGWHAPKQAVLTGKLDHAVSYEITDEPMSDEEWSKQYAQPPANP